MTNFEKKIISFLEKNHSFIGDDCAIFEDFAITTDSLVEDVHFSLDFSTPYQVGVKTATSNLSDIAAMGAKPKYFLTSLSIPEDKLYFVEGFYEGLTSILEKYNVKLIGGDTTGSYEKIFVNGVAIGEKNNNFIKRSGAKTGDKIYLCDTLGYSAIGFYILQNGIEIKNPFYAYAVKKHLEPEPQINEGTIIGKNSLASAMIDISDGLSKEINEIANKSNVKCVLYSELFKLPEIDLFDRENLIKYFLHSGEEYIILFCSPLDESEIKEFLPGAYLIGEVFEGDGAYLEFNSSLVKLGDFTYNHFDKEKGLY